MSTPAAFDIVIIGAGPAGQKAAIQGAKAGKRVALLERERGIGGSCVYRGTIPSKTLRESALHLDRLRRASAAFEFSLKPDAEISTLLSRLEEVVQTHDTYMSKQLRRNGISLFHGRARFINDRTVDYAKRFPGQEQAIMRVVKSEMPGIMAGGVQDPQMPVGLAVGRRAQLQPIPFLKHLRHTDLACQGAGGPRVGPHRHAIALGAGPNGPHMVGVPVRRHDGLERLPLGKMSIEHGEEPLLLFREGRPRIDQERLITAHQVGIGIARRGK